MSTIGKMRNKWGGDKKTNKKHRDRYRQRVKRAENASYKKPSTCISVLTGLPIEEKK